MEFSIAILRHSSPKYHQQPHIAADPLAATRSACNSRSKSLHSHGLVDLMLTIINAHGYLAGVVAFLICAGLLPLIRHTAVNLDIHDLPGHLKIHAVPIPRLGGIAIGIAILASLILSPFRGAPNVTGICLAVMVIGYIGLLFDLIYLSC